MITTRNSWVASKNVLLKCVESLAKREFEDLFGFGCGRFENGRVISFAKEVLDVFRGDDTIRDGS